jgi:hypothetical protein
MSVCSITVKVHVRWWVTHYLRTLALFARLSGRTPDAAKVGEFIARHGIRLEVK